MLARLVADLDCCTSVLPLFPDFFLVFAQPTVDTATAVAISAMSRTAASRLNVVRDDFCRVVLLALHFLRLSVGMG